MDERSLPRFFVEGAHDVGDVVALQGADARKVRLVLRRATGDAVEFASLRQLWAEQRWQPGQCVLGSVKSNIG